MSTPSFPARTLQFIRRFLMDNQDEIAQVQEFEAGVSQAVTQDLVEEVKEINSQNYPTTEALLIASADTYRASLNTPEVTNE